LLTGLVILDDVGILNQLILASSFTKLYFHTVFAVKYRNALIDLVWEAEMYSVICSRMYEMGHIVIAINGVADHVHVLWRHNRVHSIPDTMKKIKGNASHWINSKNLCADLFRFQHGYGAFTVSLDRVPMVKRYVLNQKTDHEKIDLKMEYDQFLVANGVPDEEKELAPWRFETLC
jgi:REP element-mobilizing transposase RayT